MTESARRITATKRSSLAGLGEDWGDECYAIVRPFTYLDELELQDLDLTAITPKQQVEYQLRVVREHFISGKIKILAEDGTFELVDMVPEDTAASIAIADKLYADIKGFDLDPKDLRKAVAESALQQINAKSTETSSSTGSEAEALPSIES